MTRVFATAAIALSALVALPVHALSAQVDSFEILKNGSTFFVDEFSNDLTPAQESGWSLFGSVPAGSESNGLLMLNTASGAVTKDSLRRDLRAVVVTRATPLTAAGLGSADDLQINGVFELLTPKGPLFNAYGVGVTEAVTPAQARVVQLQVEYNPATSSPTIRYQLQNFQAGTITTLGAALLAATPGADHVRLSVWRESDNNRFYGSYAFGSGGSFGPANTFLGGGELCVNAAYVRGEMFVTTADITPVPETSTVAMMGLGLAALATLRRRAAA